MSKLRDWFDRTPTVDGPTKEEIRKATRRLKREQAITKSTYGASHIERPPRTDKAQLPKIKDYSPNYNYNYDYDYEPFTAPFPPTAEEMIHKGYITQIPSHWNKEIKDENPVLDLINGYRAELNNPYVSSIIVKDVLWMLDEIENAL